MMNKDLGLIVWLLSVSVWAFAQTTGSPCTNNCVFPGDANNDHIVNKSDVLAIGLTYHYVGPVRQNPTSNWTAQSCPAWNGNIPGTNINSKYADCSGNGDVDFHDFDIVWQNYAQSQNYTPPQTTPTIPTTGVELRVLFDEDSLNIENHGGFQIYPFEAEIWVGNSNLAASDLYGLAFSIKYDSTLLGNAPLNVT